jgi:predicted PurR-regulated permease PerM
MPLATQTQMRRIAPARVTRIAILAIVIFVILWLAWAVLDPFIVPMTWAAIIAYTTWPAYRRLRDAMRGHAGLSALVMTSALIAALVVPVVWVVILLQAEAAEIYQRMQDRFATGDFALPDMLSNVPWIGERLRDFAERLTDPDLWRQEAEALASQWSGQITGLASNVGLNLFKLVLMLLALFFAYRDGDAIMDAVRRSLEAAIGPRAHAYLDTLATMTRAVVVGMLLTAIAQGLLGAIGYWAAGIPAPATLGIVTALLSLFPFGPPVVWAPLGLWLVLSGSVWTGVALLVWGTIVISSMDNIIRPLVISGAAQLHFLLVVFGALGGLAAFGFIGAFVGPLALAMLVAIWREWLLGPQGRPGRRAAAVARTGKGAAPGTPRADTDAKALDVAAPDSRSRSTPVQDVLPP